MSCNQGNFRKLEETLDPAALEIILPVHSSDWNLFSHSTVQDSRVLNVHRSQTRPTPCLE